MQRYHMQASYPTIERIADSEGLYVLYSEAQARIEALEAALRFYAEKQHIRYGALETRGRDAGWPELLLPEDGATARAALEKQP